MLTYSRSRVVATRERIRSSVMENQIEKKEHLHYNHTDSCNHARWNSRECYQFMYNKPWQKVADFYLNLVNGRLPLSDLLGNERPSSSNTSTQSVAGSLEAREQTDLPDLQTKDRSGRWARVTYKIILSYDGNSFDGWQKQPGLNTVQGLVENSLGNFVDERKAQKLKEKSLPLEAAVNVAGRTDKGVTALNQVCSFYTWRTDVKVRDVEDAINSASPGKLRVISVLKVLRDFHPNFSAKWRHYLYIFPITDGEGQISETVRDGVKPDPIRQHSEQRNGWPESEREEKDESGEVDIEDGYESGNKPKGFSVQRVNQLLHQLEGKSLSYSMFARDTKASRSTGPPTECFLYHARATEAILPCADEVYAGKNTGQKVMCVELVANRFLRRMVRVLVATSIREAAAGADDDALLKLMEATCRRATAPPAPPDGLCLVDVGYAEFNPENALIP